MLIKTKFRYFLILTCCCLGAISIARFCHRQTQGFRVSKIVNNIPTHPTSHSKIEDIVFLQDLLKQKFFYLGRGLQSFVFASEDGEYVLKIFNNRYQRKIWLYNWLSKIPFLFSYSQPHAAYYKEKLDKTFKSYEIAFSEMKELTALVCTHLTATQDLPCRLLLIDKLNITHAIDPNTIGFLVQKRATLVYPTLKEYLNNKDIDGAKQAISSLINLFFWKWRHSILDNDPLIRTNYGFVDGKAIQIDAGPLSKGTTEINPEEEREEITRITSSLKYWLNENCPELIPFLDQELHKHLSSSQ